MKRLYVLGSVFLTAATLAACGGGSAPGPLPSTQPKTVYTAQLRFVGPLAGVTIQDDLRRAQSAEPMTATASPVPVMVISSFESGVDTSVYGGEVQAVVSPMPSSSPQISFVMNNPDAKIVTPNPQVSPQPLPTGVIAQVEVKGTNAVQVQTPGTVSATIGAPVDQTPTTNVYAYQSIALDCYPGPDNLVAAGSSTPYTAHFGWKYDGTSWVPDDNMSDADIYIDGPGCMAQDPNDTEPTIHVHGGDTRISTDTPFCNVLATQWTNSEQSFVNPPTSNPDGSLQLLVIGHTRDGLHTFKLFPNHPFLFGAIETSGPSSVDGF